MKKSTGLFLSALALGIAVLFVIQHAMAQDMAKVHKGTKVLLDNEQVRVLEVTLKPGEKTGMHSHPNHVIYAVKGGVSKAWSPDGKSTELETKDGEARWMAATTHDTENTGKGAVKVVVIELKEKK